MNLLRNIQLSSRSRLIICLSLCLAGFIFNCIAYYPGFMTSDSFDQYSQALTKTYHDWHPPIMAAFWSILLVFHKGPEPLFFLQMLLLWTSFYFLLSFFMRHYLRSSFLIVLFVFSPFVQNFSGVVLKDFQMSLSWLLAVVLMLRAFFEKRPLNKIELFICLVTLTYGCWLRFNALAGAIPLLILLVHLSGKNQENIKWSPLLLKTSLLSLAIVISQLAINHFLIKPQRVFPENKIYMLDLTGIYVKTKKNYFPPFIKSYHGFDSLYLEENYNTATFDHIWWNPHNKDLFPAEFLISNADSSKVLRHYWFKAISENKAVYLKNRYEGFLYYLRIKNRTQKFYGSSLYTLGNNFGISFKPNKLSTLFIDSIHAQEDLFYMRPWFWVLLNIALLLGAFIKQVARMKWMILVLSFSSLFYLLPQFFIFQIDTDFRYFYWNCLSVSLALILFVAELFKPKEKVLSSQ